jgi:hypothetical protein
MLPARDANTILGRARMVQRYSGRSNEIGLDIRLITMSEKSCLMEGKLVVVVLRVSFVCWVAIPRS